MHNIIREVDSLATGQTFTIPIHDFALVLGVTATEAFSLLGGLTPYWICTERQWTGERYAGLLADLAANRDITVHIVRAPGVSPFIPAVSQAAAAGKKATRAPQASKP